MLQFSPDKSSTPAGTSNNLKVLIAAEVFGVQLETVPDHKDHFSLREPKSGFTLIEPNAIVKYLGSLSLGSECFKPSEIISFEEKLSNGKPADVPFPGKVDVRSVEQIILFSSLYALGQTCPFCDKFSSEPSLNMIVSSFRRGTPDNKGISNVKAGFTIKSKESQIEPKEGERNILITSALPYVNNVPHLGNIVGSVLSADVYARYVKARNYNSLFICGTDEYGTATETKALEEKITPRELCDKYHAIHKQVYDWFQIGFDYFGRTTTEKQTQIAQDIFMKLSSNGYLEPQTMNQLYCPVHKGFLADRYVEGTCPKCSYEDARGDQCDKCGNLLNPFELIDPRCKLDDAKPEPRDSQHIFLKLDKLEPELRDWIAESSEKGNWSKNSRTITNSWLREGLNPRCITRDLVWGTPVPLEGFTDKVLYVWFDATIGYVSITANYTDNWEKWWYNPENISLYQFMGKDNVPFHTVVFPATQIGTRDNWTQLHHLNTTEYLQYEGGKFSKSRGVGVFGNNAQDTGISPSVWRYYLTSVRPETSDSHFSWDEFVARNNNELLANLGNFVNRIVKFACAKYNGVVPAAHLNSFDYSAFSGEVDELLKQYNEAMESVQLRKGLELAMAISSKGNQFLQENKLDNSLFTNHPQLADTVVAVGLNMVYLVGSVMCPFMPETTEQINKMLNAPALKIGDKFELVIQEGHCIGKPVYLFKRIEESKIEEWRSKYGGQN